MGLSKCINTWLVFRESSQSLSFLSPMAAPHVYQREVQPRLPMFTAWERVRHGKAHWLIECIAETVRYLRYNSGTDVH